MPKYYEEEKIKSIGNHEITFESINLNNRILVSNHEMKIVMKMKRDIKLPALDCLYLDSLQELKLYMCAPFRDIYRYLRSDLKKSFKQFETDPNYFFIKSKIEKLPVIGSCELVFGKIENSFVCTNMQNRRLMKILLPTVVRGNGMLTEDGKIKQVLADLIKAVLDENNIRELDKYDIDMIFPYERRDDQNH